MSANATGGYDETDVKVILVRRRRILAKLQIMSEAPVGQALDTKPQIAHLKGTSTPPPEARTEFPEEGAPPRDVSLFAHYEWRFNAASRDIARTELLCALAERDHREHAYGNRTPWNEEAASADRRILREWKGWSATEVAVHERTNPEAVRKLRRLHYLDPETGTKAELSERDRAIIDAIRNGATERQTATRFEIDRSSVRRLIGTLG